MTERPSRDERTELGVRPLVSAIIPTTGRATALAAISSALKQTLPQTEVVVAFDGAEKDWLLSVPETPRLRIVTTGGPSGVGAARTAGTKAARGDYIAFLDDDDVWLPRKLEVQFDLIRARRKPSKHVLVSGRVSVVDAGGHAQLLVPRRLKADDESVAEYLFRRRQVRWGEALFHPSTIMCDRELALRTAWGDTEIHEDWDWLLRISRRHNVDILMSDMTLAAVAETPGSASRSGNWRGSLEWVTANRAQLSDGQWADFLLCTTAPYAKAAGERLQALKLLCTAVSQGSPSASALLFFVLYQVGPTRLLTRLARLSVRRSA